MSLFVNQRIQLVHGPHNRGTVRYIGPVPGQPSHQQWVGVEWDDETKGKHNGTVNQTMQLFTTFQNRNSASFVKLDKLMQAISTQGANDETEQCSVMNHVSLTDAIQQRYVNAPNEKLIELTLGKSMRVEIVGADKIASKMAQVSTLKKMGLPSCKISSVDGIGEMCPNLRELDLSGNLLYHIDQVCLLLSQLSVLKFLNLSQNIVSFDSQQHGSNLPKFEQLETLVWNFGHLSWSNIETLLAMFPNLQELHVRDNSLSAISVDKVELWRNISFLNLAGNRISDWSHVQKLSQLPSLTKLQLSKNQIQQIPDISGFEQLESLSINDNAIVDWQSIFVLTKLPKLTELRIDNNTIAEKYGAVLTRTYALAMLSNVELLNGSEARRKEKDEAEKYFAKFFNENMKNDPVLSLDIFQQHLKLLMNKWGISTEETKSQPLPKKNIVEITIRNSLATEEDKNEVKKKIPVNMTVYKLKQLCARLFKIDIETIQLSYKHPEASTSENLKEDYDQVSFYGIDCDGGEVTIESVDTAKEERIKREEEKRAQDNMTQMQRDIEQQMAWRQL